MSDPYAKLGGGGKLKLKGVKDSRVDKQHKKKKKQKGERKEDDDPDISLGDTSVVLGKLDADNAAAIDEKLTNLDTTQADPSLSSKPLKGNDDDHDDADENYDDSLPTLPTKTEAEKRHDQQRRKRLEDRLKKEGGAKTHKQRVEELNRYLSGLSEHHDMPKIGPG